MLHLSRSRDMAEIFCWYSDGRSDLMKQHIEEAASYCKAFHLPARISQQPLESSELGKGL